MNRVAAPPSVRAAGVAATVALVALVLALTLPWGTGSRHSYGDEHLYLAYGNQVQAGDVPYRDFFVEYPPGALPVFVGPALVDGHERSAFRVLMAILWSLSAAAAVLAAARCGLGGVRLALVGVSLSGFVAVFAPLLLNTYDAWPALLVAVALLAHLRRNDALAGGALGLAVAAKLLPVLLVPLLWRVAARRGGGRRHVVAFILAGAAVTLPFLLLAPTGLAHSLETQLRRGLHVESVPATAFLVADALGAVVRTANEAPGSLNVLGGAADAVSWVASGVLIVVTALILRRQWRRGRDRETVLACAVLAAATLSVGKVFSPQFMTWALPVVAATGSLPALALLLCAAGLSIAFPLGWLTPFDLDGEEWWAVARNGLVIAVVVVLYRRLAREPRDEKGIQGDHPEAAGADDERNAVRDERRGRHHHGEAEEGGARPDTTLAHERHLVLLAVRFRRSTRPSPSDRWSQAG